MANDIPCSIEGCHKPARKRGWCYMHYGRYQRTGDPTKIVREYGRAPCTVDGCERPVFGHGWCQMHYARWRRDGDVGVAGPKDRSLPRMTAEQSFWRHVDVSGPVPEAHPEMGRCWQWTGGLSHGYGVVNGDKHRDGAHRFSYELHVGPIPDGLDIDHLCHQPPCPGGDECPHRSCVNPDHLEPVTRGENLLRSPLTVPGRNERKTHCPAGHPYDEKNTRIERDGGRKCRACGRERYHARKVRLADGNISLDP